MALSLLSVLLFCPLLKEQETKRPIRRRLHQRLELAKFTAI